MGRAQGGRVSAAASPLFHADSGSNQDPFTTLLGSQRGLSAAQANASAEAARQRLIALQNEVSANRMSSALRELDVRASEVESDPLLNELLTGVARALTDNAAIAEDEKSRELLAALLIEPHYADHLLIHYGDGNAGNTLNTLHIWPDGDQQHLDGGERLATGSRGHTACGIRFMGPLSNDKGSPFCRAVRGSWQQPPAGVTHCVSCFRHERDYDDCATTSSSPLLGEHTNLAIRACASARLRKQISQRLRLNEGASVSELSVIAEEYWRDETMFRLSERAVADGEPFLQRLLGGHYLRCQRRFGVRSTRLRSDRRLAELLNAADWRSLFELVRMAPSVALTQRLLPELLKARSAARG